MQEALKSIKDAFIANPTEVLMSTATILLLFVMVYGACYIDATLLN